MVIVVIAVFTPSDKVRVTVKLPEAVLGGDIIRLTPLNVTEKGAFEVIVIVTGPFSGSIGAGNV